MEQGRLIAGRFRIGGLAGTGGMGKVYRARDEVTGDDVALKVLSLDAKRYSRRFSREASVMAELKHPNIVGYKEYGETDRGAPFIVMEWVDGEDLRQRMNRKRVSPDEALKVIACIGEALGFAHARGIIHRDLKPSNLMLVDSDINNVKLLDFGIARWRGPEVEKMTRTGISIGTPGYMAPEQGRGEAEIDGRADLYALGCVIYECLVGRRPFQGEDAVAVMTRTALDEPPRLSEKRDDISDEFDELLADMMSVSPEKRPASGYALAERARSIKTGSKQAAQEESSEGLTSAERQLFCLLLVEPTGKPPQGVPDDSDTVLRNTVLEVGGETELLKNGTSVITFSNTATNMVVCAARCALEIRSQRPDAAIAMATGQAEISGRHSMAKTIESVANLLRAAQQSIPDSGDRSIRISETTARLLDNRFVTQEPNSDKRLGVELLAERSEVGYGTPGAQACVGRANEIKKIYTSFLSALHGESQAVVLTGDAGIGKTRVREEVEALILSKHSNTAVWKARGDAVSRGSAFHMLKQLVQQAAGVVQSDSLATRRTKLRVRVGQSVPDKEVQRVAEFLGELSGTPFSARNHVQLHAARGNAVLMGDQMRRAWQDFLTAEASKHPVLIILEDLHLGDLPTVRLIDGALRKISGVPWMVLAVARPEVEEVFPELWLERNLIRLALPGLDAAACRTIITSTLKSPTDDAINRLTRLSSGNAFYLEELLRAVKDDRSTQVPKTVLAMAQARLHRLSPETRRVLRAASVFGHTFWVSGLSNLLGSAAHTMDVDELVDELIELDFIMKCETSALGKVSEYSFRQELVREAVYSTLTDRDRELGHRLAGDWLQDAGIRDPLMLATHFEIGRDFPKASRWYQHAAHQALEGNDLLAAIRRAKQGIAVGAKGKTLGLLHATLGRAQLWNGDNQEASRHSSQALDTLTSGSQAWAAAAGDCVTALGHCSDYEQIIVLANALLLPELDGPIASALARAASCLYLADRKEAATDILARIQAGIDLNQCNPEVAGHVLTAMAHQALHAGDPSSHLKLSQRSALRFKDCGDRRSATITQVSVGFAYMELGDYMSAERVLRLVLNIAEEMEIHSISALARNNLGRTMLALGRLDEAWDLEVVAIESFAMQGAHRLANSSRVYLSKILQCQKALPAAEREAREAIEQSAAYPSVAMRAAAQFAAVSLDKGDISVALEFALEANAMLDAAGQMDEGVVFTRLILAEAYSRSGDEGLAQAALMKAYECVRVRLSAIESEKQRTSFLQGVEENRRVIALADEWGLPKLVS